MSKKVFNLKFVPNDEANGVRDALDAAGIEFFETPPGYLSMLGLNAAGIWVADNQAGPARVVINTFQQQWLEKVREETADQPDASRRADKFMMKFLLVVGMVAVFVIYLLNKN